jgi:plastocyanin domain-containing protein
VKNDFLFITISTSIIILLIATCYYALQPSGLPSPNAPIHIMVSNQGYQPAMIQVSAGKEVKLQIVRQNAEICKTGIEFPQLNRAFPFMLDIPINVSFAPQTPGMVDFNCRDGSARGRIVIV